MPPSIADTSAEIALSPIGVEIDGVSSATTVPSESTPVQPTAPLGFGISSQNLFASSQVLATEEQTLPEVVSGILLRAPIEPAPCNILSMQVPNPIVFLMQPPVVSRAITVNHIGAMCNSCSFCGALFFSGERMFCCYDGRMQLPAWRQPPQVLCDLLKIPEFRLRSRAYNSAFALGSSVFKDMTKDQGPATFTMEGRHYHLIGPVDSQRDVKRYAQIYCMSIADATVRRVEMMTKVVIRSEWVESLTRMLLEHNRLIQTFKRAADACKNWTVSIPAMEAHATESLDEVVGILANGGGVRELIVPFQAGGLTIIDELNPFFQPLHFVLLFPFGCSQWGLHLQKRPHVARRRSGNADLESDTVDSGIRVTALDFLRFYIQRRDEPVSLHSFGRLYEEWIVDCFLQNENLKLNWLRRNQSQVRFDVFLEQRGSIIIWPVPTC